MKPDASAALARLADWHEPDCACPICRPAAPAEPRLAAAANRVALAILAGFAAGVAICWLLDLATGAHGVVLMFGGR